MNVPGWIFWICVLIYGPPTIAWLWHRLCDLIEWAETRP